MLDQISNANPIVASGLQGILVSHCQHCGAIGQKEGERVRYDHTDDCLLALNARLQATIKEGD
jgi:hypothetical protein